MKKLALLSLIFFTTLNSHGKAFRNAYVAFDLPDKWDCAMQVTDWVCRSAVTTTAKEAVIVLTAKERGPMDELSSYEAHLKAPKAMMDLHGKTVQSKVVQTKSRQIAGQTWVDSLHLNSEVPGYYTRYMATVKDKIGIVVTFSAHQTVYTKYSQDFFNAILSMRVVADKNLLGDGGGRGGAGGGDVFGVGLGGLPQDTGEMPQEQAKQDNSMWLALAALIAGLAIYLFLRARKKKR